jgi:hypothetical protein
MKRIVRLTESDLSRIVKRVIVEGEDPNSIEGLMACKSGTSGKYMVIKGTNVLMGKRMSGEYGTICIIK